MSLSSTRILLATDGSDDARAAGNVASELASRTNSELHVVHAWQYNAPYGVGYPEYEGLYEEHARDLLSHEVERLQDAGAKVERAHLLVGRPSDRVCELARDLDAGLIVVGSRGLGTLGRLLVGSVSEGVVRRSPSPVLVVRADTQWPPSRVVAGDDYSQDSLRAAGIAAELAELYNAELLLIHAHPQLPELSPSQRASDARMAEDALRKAEQTLEERARELERNRLKPRIRLCAGEPALTLVEAAEEKEGSVISVGSRGLGAIERLRLGSVSTKVLHAFRGPILVTPLKKD